MPPFALGDLTPAAFLTDTWQQRPLLVRNALPGFADPLDKDALIALAADEAVESRLVRRLAGRDGAADDWSVEDGPIAPRRLKSLGATDWTVLVQGVDAWVPAVARLVDHFRFLPNWRLDDVMVSYAVPGGGVGPHVDQYDVFLVQAVGRRRWRIGPVGADNGPLRDHPRLQLLARMPVAEEHVLAPGDLLYLPPGVAHDGEALEPGFTYSIGLRAPSVAELLGALAHQAADEPAGAVRFRDAAPPIQDNPGLISEATLAEVRRLLATALADDRLLAQAFAREVTEPKLVEALDLPDQPLSATEIRQRLAAGAGLARAGGARLAYVEETDGVTLYANGVAYDCPGDLAELARRLAARTPVAAADLAAWPDDGAAALLADLVNDGVLGLD